MYSVHHHISKPKNRINRRIKFCGLLDAPGGVVELLEVLIFQPLHSLQDAPYFLPDLVLVLGLLGQVVQGPGHATGSGVMTLKHASFLISRSLMPRPSSSSALSKMSRKSKYLFDFCTSDKLLFSPLRNFFLSVIIPYVQSHNMLLVFLPYGVSQ